VAWGDVFSAPFGLALGAVVLAGLVRGFSGFGSALVMNPLLSADAVFGPAAGVPIGTLLDGILAVPFVPASAPLVDWRRIGPLAIAALVTLPAGAWLLLHLDPTPIRWAMSAIVLSAVAILTFGWRFHGRPRVAATAATGLVSGLFAGASGMAGPPVIFYYLSGPDAAAKIRASLIVYFAVLDAFSLTIYGYAGAITLLSIERAALLCPAYLGAAYLGARLFPFASERFYRHLALGILVGIAVGSLFL